METEQDAIYDLMSDKEDTSKQGAMVEVISIEGEKSEDGICKLKAPEGTKKIIIEL